MAEVMGIGKHSSLLRYGNNYCHKKFYSTGPWREKMGKQFYNISPASMFLSEAIISLETKGLRRLRRKKKS
jgi:hypothetical protein